MAIAADAADATDADAPDSATDAPGAADGAVAANADAADADAAEIAVEAPDAADAVDATGAAVATTATEATAATTDSVDAAGATDKDAAGAGFGNGACATSCTNAVGTAVADEEAGNSARTSCCIAVAPRGTMNKEASMCEVVRCSCRGKRSLQRISQPHQCQCRQASAAPTAKGDERKRLAKQPSGVGAARECAESLAGTRVRITLAKETLTL